MCMMLLSDSLAEHISAESFDSYYCGRGRNRQLPLISLLWTPFQEYKICLTYGEPFKQTCSLEHSTNNLIWKYHKEKVVLLCYFLTDFHTNDLWECVKFGILIWSQEKSSYIFEAHHPQWWKPKPWNVCWNQGWENTECHVLSRTYWLSYGSHLFSYMANQKPWEEANTNCYR